MPSEECLMNGSLSKCYTDPFHWIFDMPMLGVLCFYLYRFGLCIYSSIKTSLKSNWTQIVFWILQLLSTICSIVTFFSKLTTDTAAEDFLVYIIKPYANFLPLILLTIFILKVSQTLNPMYSSTNRLRTIFILCGVFGVLFLIEIVMFIIMKRKWYFYPLSTVFVIITYLISFITFLFNSVDMLSQIYDLQISGLPRNFFRNMVIGTSTVAFLLLFYTFMNTMFLAYVNTSGIEYIDLIHEKYNVVVRFQLATEVFGLILPNLLISIGIIYITNSATVTSYEM